MNNLAFLGGRVLGEWKIKEICNYSLRQLCTLYVPQKSIRRTECYILTPHRRQFCKNFTHSFPWRAPNFPFALPLWPFAFLLSVFQGAPDLLGPDPLRVTFSGTFSITKTFSPLPVTLRGRPSGAHFPRSKSNKQQCLQVWRGKRGHHMFGNTSLTP